MKLAESLYMARVWRNLIALSVFINCGFYSTLEAGSKCAFYAASLASAKSLQIAAVNNTDPIFIADYLAEFRQKTLITSKAKPLWVDISSDSRSDSRSVPKNILTNSANRLRAVERALRKKDPLVQAFQITGNYTIQETLKKEQANSTALDARWDRTFIYRAVVIGGIAGLGIINPWGVFDLAESIGYPNIAAVVSLATIPAVLNFAHLYSTRNYGAKLREIKIEDALLHPEYSTNEWFLQSGTAPLNSDLAKDLIDGEVDPVSKKYSHPFGIWGNSKATSKIQFDRLFHIRNNENGEPEAVLTIIARITPPATKQAETPKTTTTKKNPIPDENTIFVWKFGADRRIVQVESEFYLYTRNPARKKGDYAFRIEPIDEAEASMWLMGGLGVIRSALQAFLPTKVGLKGESRTLVPDEMVKFRKDIEKKSTFRFDPADTGNKNKEQPRLFPRAFTKPRTILKRSLLIPAILAGAAYTFIPLPWSIPSSVLTKKVQDKYPSRTEPRRLPLAGWILNSPLEISWGQLKKDPMFNQAMEKAKKDWGNSPSVQKKLSDDSLHDPYEWIEEQKKPSLIWAYRIYSVMESWKKQMRDPKVIDDMLKNREHISGLSDELTLNFILKDPENQKRVEWSDWYVEAEKRVILYKDTGLDRPDLKSKIEAARAAQTIKQQKILEEAKAYELEIREKRNSERDQQIDILMQSPAYAFLRSIHGYKNSMELRDSSSDLSVIGEELQVLEKNLKDPELVSNFFDSLKLDAKDALEAPGLELLLGKVLTQPIGIKTLCEFLRAQPVKEHPRYFEFIHLLIESGHESDVQANIYSHDLSLAEAYEKWKLKYDEDAPLRLAKREQKLAELRNSPEGSFYIAFYMDRSTSNLSKSDRDLKNLEQNITNFHKNISSAYLEIYFKSIEVKTPAEVAIETFFMMFQKAIGAPNLTVPELEKLYLFRIFEKESLGLDIQISNPPTEDEIRIIRSMQMDDLELKNRIEALVLKEKDKMGDPIWRARIPAVQHDNTSNLNAEQIRATVRMLASPEAVASTNWSKLIYSALINPDLAKIVDEEIFSKHPELDEKYQKWWKQGFDKPLPKSDSKGSTALPEFKFR